MDINSEWAAAQSGSVAPIGLITMAGTEQLGEKIEGYLTSWADDCGNLRIGHSCPRFSTGDSKGIIKETVRGKDLYFLIDVGNYSRTYRFFGEENRMSPDDHYQDLKRLIQAVGGKAHRINVIMPILYGGRQHRRTYRESLDCACMLQELEGMGVQNLITFDAHDPRVQNAVPLMGFDNIMPYYQVLKSLLRNYPGLSLAREDFMVVSPDEGAMARNMYYSSVLGVDLGMFYKRRDYSRIVNGRNPITAHEYLGDPAAGKVVLVTDDIISSGDSMLDIAYEIKKGGAEKILCFATYGIFTDGFERFDKAFDEGIIDRVLSTNLTYQPEGLLHRPWYISVDMSKYIAHIISSLNHEQSVSMAIDPHKKITELLKKHGV